MAKANFSVARVQTRTTSTIGKFERHNERKNEHYGNMNVDLSRTPMNVHFKSCGDLTYNEYLNKLVADGQVSLRGLKKDAKVFDEMILDVNTDYFETHGGYAFARDFYAEAYRFAAQVYGEENIISAVMHADEVNLALSDRYGYPVYHYHLHIIALPVVDKEIRWSKRCKDKSLVGTVKEVVHQVSHSKKWKSPQAVDEDGKPMFDEKGKAVLIPTYSILQDKFYDHMKQAGFHDFLRGERGSTAENQSSLQYQIEQDKKRLAELQRDIQRERVNYQAAHDIHMGFSEIEQSGKKTLTGKYTVSAEDYEKVTTLAKNSFSAQSEAQRLREENSRLQQRVWSLQTSVQRLEDKLEELTKLCGPYLEALKAAPQRVKSFLDDILQTVRKQRADAEKTLFYAPAEKKTEPELCDATAIPLKQMRREVQER